MDICSGLDETDSTSGVFAEAILPAGGAPSLADESEDGVQVSQPEKMTWTELGLDEYR